MWLENVDGGWIHGLSVDDAPAERGGWLSVDGHCIHGPTTSARQTVEDTAKLGLKIIVIDENMKLYWIRMLEL
jgi:hypothetical protein